MYNSICIIVYSWYISHTIGDPLHATTTSLGLCLLITARPQLPSHLYHMYTYIQCVNIQLDNDLVVVAYIL